MDLDLKNIFSKFSFKKMVIYLNVILVIFFLVTFLFIGNFINDNVYKVISIEDTINIDQSMMNSLIVNLNVDKFENIIKNIEDKIIPREVKNFKNIFR